jgi:putative ABC transport system permease protein
VRTVESARVAWRALRANILRSALTTLGVVIGVAAVIATVSVGAGAQARVAEQLRRLGPDLVYITPGSASSGGVRLGYGSRRTITVQDAEALGRELPTVLAAAPSVWVNDVQVVYGNANWSTTVHGTTPDHESVRRSPVISGRYFVDDEVNNAAKVALLGQTVADALFGATDPVGQVIRVAQVPLVVIGVLERKGRHFRGRDQDDTVLVPITTATQRVARTDAVKTDAVQGILTTPSAQPLTSAAQPVTRMEIAKVDAIHGITVRVRDASRLREATGQIHKLLRQRHDLLPSQEDDFATRNVAEVLQAEEESTRVLTVLLGAIASISLLVGGIGIMNIMLVSVTERTREIGIRLAVGARGRDILGQFLVEAVTLALIGGAIGVVLGVATSHAIAYFASWHTVIALDAVLLAFAFAAATGVFFGLYPARKAAQLEPAEALRYE